MPKEKFKKVSFTADGKKVSFKAKMKKRKVKYNFPKNPSKGELKTIHNKRRKRKITFEATGKKFPAWKIIRNVKA